MRKTILLWLILHEIWDTHRLEEAISNENKSSKFDIAFMVAPQVKSKAQIMTMGLTLKAMSNWNDFGVIR